MVEKSPVSTGATAMGVSAALLLALLVTIHATSGVYGDFAQDFESWANKSGIYTRQIKLDFIDATVGRGLLAREEIKEGDVLFRIPLQWVMSSDAARQLPYLGTAFEEGKDLLPKGMEGEKMKVAIMLMFEDCKLGPNSVQKCDVGKQTSKWRPYLDMLPRNFSAPLFWSDEEVEELKGSQVYTMHKGDKEGLDMEWDAVKAVMGGNRNTKCCFDDKEKYKWAVMCINSRALTLQGVKYLIPIADMVNYQARDGDVRRKDHQEVFLKHHRVGGGFAQIHADRDFSIGSQIVESYGNNANSMYLRWFGFVPEKNPTDCVGITFSAMRTQAEELKELQVPPRAEACLRLGEEPPVHMLRFLRAANIKGEEERAKAMSNAYALNSLLSVRNERAVLRALSDKGKKRLKAFPTSDEEDMLALQKGVDVWGVKLTHNRELAIRVRLSEKRILRELVRVTADALEITRSPENARKAREEKEAKYKPVDVKFLNNKEDVPVYEVGAGIKEKSSSRSRTAQRDSSEPGSSAKTEL